MNIALFDFFYGFAHRGTGLDAAIIFIARDFVWVIIVGLFFYLLKNRDRHAAVRDLAIVFGAALVGIAVAAVLKNIFQTLRPFDAIKSVQSLITESGFAFPSGHTTLVASLAGALWSAHKRPAIFVGLAGILVGASRVMAGVHWPVDILGGFLIGSIVGAVIYYLAHRLSFFQ